MPDILLSLSSNGFYGDIPLANYSTWFLIKDKRSQKKFWDMVEAFAVLRFKQRPFSEEGNLIALKQDFLDAKELFMGSAENHQSKLTNAQVEIIRIIGLILDG